MARRKKDRFGAKPRLPARERNFGRALKGRAARAERTFGAKTKLPKRGDPWAERPASAKREGRKRKRSFLDKFFTRRSQLTLRRYYQRIDDLEYDRLKREASNKIAGDVEEAKDLVRIVTGKPLSPTGQSRVKRYVEDRAERLRTRISELGELVEGILSIFGIRPSA